MTNTMIQLPIICIFAILSGCSISKQTAPIEYNHNQKPRVIEFSNAQNSAYGQITDYEDNINQGTTTSQEPKIIYHEVKLEENIEDIADLYNMTASEVAKLNNIPAPYNLREYQILKVYNRKSNTEEIIIPGTVAANSSLLNQEVIPHIHQKDDSFILPVKGDIISKYGDKTNLGVNKGINIAAEEGTEVLASKAGKVVYSNYDATYGNLVIIKLDQSNIFLTYAHLKSTELGVGDIVSKGEVIGFVGSTGKVTSAQLHFGVRDGKLPKDPMNYIK